MITIQTTITWTGTDEQLNLLLNENGYTGTKPVYDTNGEPVWDIEYLTNEDGDFILDANNQKIEISRTQAEEPMSREEYLDYLIKEGSTHGGGIMPMIRGTTASLQGKFGSLQYDSKAMNEAMSNLINVVTEITE